MEHCPRSQVSFGVVLQSLTYRRSTSSAVHEWDFSQLYGSREFMTTSCIDRSLGLVLKWGRMRLHGSNITGATCRSSVGSDTSESKSCDRLDGLSDDQSCRCSVLIIPGKVEIDQQGLYGVSIDGGPVQFYSGYAQNERVPAVLYASSGLPLGDHTVVRIAHPGPLHTLHNAVS